MTEPGPVVGGAAVLCGLWWPDTAGRSIDQRRLLSGERREERGEHQGLEIMVLSQSR